MLLPMMFPKARPVSPLMVEVTETASSGREVPIATTVKPMMRGDILTSFDNLTVKETKRLVENNKMTKLDKNLIVRGSI